MSINIETVKNRTVMKTARTYWNFTSQYGIKHISETDVWSIYKMPSFEYVTVAHSLNKARKMIKELENNI